MVEEFAQKRAQGSSSGWLSKNAAPPASWGVGHAASACLRATVSPARQPGARPLAGGADRLRVYPASRDHPRDYGV